MAQFLKIKEGITINADAVDYVFEAGSGTAVNIVLTSTAYDLSNDVFTPYFELAQSQVGKTGNLVKAINKALTSNPGGRVVEVGPGDYTIGAITYKQGDMN
jgi:hypothetical protein